MRDEEPFAAAYGGDESPCIGCGEWTWWEELTIDDEGSWCAWCYHETTTGRGLRDE